MPIINKQNTVTHFIYDPSSINAIMQISLSAFWFYNLLIVHENGGIREKVERRPLSSCWPP